MGDSKIFKCGFDITDYQDILPSCREYMQDDFVINQDHYLKGDIDKCVWKKYVPEPGEINSPQYRAREVKRILKTGAWIKIKTEIIWLEPAYYFVLQYGKVGESDLEFRLKRLMNSYFRIKARNTPTCLGTLVLKNRADGETTVSLSNGLWECAQMDVGQIGIQSKTRSDSINPCWSTVQTIWQSLPNWIRNDIFSDMVSGDNIAEKMQWMRNGDDERGIKAKNVRMQYYPCVYNAMDGKHQMKKCILDEVAKWIECEFADAFTNYSKFIMPGFERKGLFDIFSSPSDVPTKSNEQVYELWKKSNTDEIDPITGTTVSGVHRHYSNPLHGIQGAYDKFGDADADKIYDWIMRTRKAVSKDKLMGEIRGFPLNENEMFGSFDGSSLWDNQKGIEERKIYLLGHRFKDIKTKEPTVVFGNLEWHDGIIDTEVDFRMTDKTDFDVDNARFCISYFPKNKEELKRANVIVRGESIGDRPKPPIVIQSCLGIDPYGKRYPGKSFSNGAMVNQIFLDIYQTGIVKCPNLIYLNRPSHQEIFFEDAIKAAIYCRSMIQPESINDKIIDYCEDRGYMDWMLSKIGHSKSSLQKGDAPTGGKNAYLDEIISLINAATNTPLLDTDQYLLELNWFYHLLDCVSKLNKSDTHSNDLSMAWGASLLGCVKMLYKKVRKPSALNNGVLDYLLN